ncbi:MAG: peptidoglycan editing factor PgeF [Rubritepida sp.]|nr:peptidoglycan editing factor PgeF [Rubritepida sp.]
MAEHLTHAALTARHGFFTRRGGVSGGAYATLNCGLRGDDDPAHVAANRARVAAALGATPERLSTLHQVHGRSVLHLAAPLPAGAPPPQADALVTDRPGVLLGVLTADCAPVLFEDAAAGVIGAAHAGWRGAVGGVLEATLDAMEALGARRARIAAVIGPCIGAASYEVGEDLHAAVGDARFFTPGRDARHFQFDLPAFCAHRLREVGRVEILAHDTCVEEARFFSHRRRTRAGGGPLGHQISAIML